MGAFSNSIRLLFLIFSIVSVQGGFLFHKFDDDFHLFHIFDLIGSMKCNHKEVYRCLSPDQENCDYRPETLDTTCQFGCYCRRGYIRLSDAPNSPCIRRQQCLYKDMIPERTPYCGENKEYYTCGSDCASTCKDLFYPHTPKLCLEQCTPGCSCSRGLYLSQDDKCMTPEQCCTQPNEHYEECGTNCPETCHTVDKMCNKRCIPGCFCKPGFVRKNNSTNSICIEHSKC